MTVVTVNRVQDLYDNSVYSAAITPGTTSDDAAHGVADDLIALDQLFRDNQHFDGDFYKTTVRALHRLCARTSLLMF